MTFAGLGPFANDDFAWTQMNFKNFLSSSLLTWKLNCHRNASLDFQLFLQNSSNLARLLKSQ